MAVQGHASPAFPLSEPNLPAFCCRVLWSVGSTAVPRTGYWPEMSQENVEIVRRVFEASARHDAEAVLALYDPASNGTPLGRSPDSAGSPTSTADTTASVVSFAGGPMNGVRSDPVWRHHVDIRAAVAAARECDRAVVAGKGTVRSRRGESIAENRVGDCLLQSFQSPIPVRGARSAGRRYTVSEKERAGDPLRGNAPTPQGRSLTLGRAGDQASTSFPQLVPQGNCPIERNE